MATKIIDGIEYISVADYYLAPPDTEFMFIEVDANQNRKILDHTKMTTRDALMFNQHARLVGEVFIQWEPAIF